MLPLYDESARSLSPPYVTLSLILINVLVFGYVVLGGNFDEIIEQYGAIPSLILAGENYLTLLTSMFLHVGILHLISNMWFLWLFGDNLEHNLGKIRFLLFYFLAGIFSTLFYVFGVQSAQAGLPVVGASGAISGLMGGYFILYPKNRIRAFLLIFYYPILFWVPAYFYIGFWFLLQLLYVGGEPTSIAYLAHVGGFVAGLLLILFLKRKIAQKDYF